MTQQTLAQSRVIDPILTTHALGYARPGNIGKLLFPEATVGQYDGKVLILLRKPRSRIKVYNDLDEEIVSIFRVVQDPVTCHALMRRLRRTPYARREFELAFQASSDPVIRAARAITRAYQSFHHEALFNSKK